MKGSPDTEPQPLIARPSVAKQVSCWFANLFCTERLTLQESGVNEWWIPVHAPSWMSTCRGQLFLNTSVIAWIAPLPHAPRPMPSATIARRWVPYPPAEAPFPTPPGSMPCPRRRVVRICRGFPCGACGWPHGRQGRVPQRVNEGRPPGAVVQIPLWWCACKLVPGRQTDGFPALELAVSVLDPYRYLPEV